MIEIKSASGGTIETLTRHVPNRMGPDGVLLVEITFRGAERRGVRWTPILSIELPAEEGDEGRLVLRRAARSVVAFGSKIASDIRNLKLPPTIRSKAPPAGRYEVLFTTEVRVNGLIRSASVRCTGAGSRSSRLTPEMPDQAAWALQRLAHEIHGAVALPENQAAFGE